MHNVVYTHWVVYPGVYNLKIGCQYSRYLNIWGFLMILQVITLFCSFRSTFSILHSRSVFMNSVLKLTFNRKDSSTEQHEPWLARLLDRAAGLFGKRRFFAGVWIKRFRAFCYESSHVGLDVVPLAKGYLSRLTQWRDLEPWQVDQATEALRLFVRETERWRWVNGRIHFRLRTTLPVGQLDGCSPDRPAAASSPSSFPSSSPSPVVDRPEMAVFDPHQPANKSNETPNCAVIEVMRSTMRGGHYALATESSYLSLGETLSCVLWRRSARSGTWNSRGEDVPGGAGLPGKGDGFDSEPSAFCASLSFSSCVEAFARLPSITICRIEANVALENERPRSLPELWRGHWGDRLRLTPTNEGVRSPGKG